MAHNAHQPLTQTLADNVGTPEAFLSSNADSSAKSFKKKERTIKLKKKTGVDGQKVCPVALEV